MKNKAFTLIELLIVMAILGILATIGIGGLRTSQMRSRDAQRKSDVKQLAGALELYYSDHGRYPGATVDGLVKGCPSTSETACSWGSNTSFEDGQTVFIRLIPEDPQGGNYFYKVSNDFSKFQIFTHLENSKDKNCIDGNCAIPSLSGVSCGDSLNCNYAVTSTNAGPKDNIDL